MLKSKSNWILLMCIITLFVISSCDRYVVFDQYVTIPGGGWNMDSMAVFKVDIESTEQAYDVVLNVRNRSDYPNSNLWLFVDVISPGGIVVQDKIDCTLADDNGKWVGSGWGSLYHVKVPYQKGVRFAEKGQYTFRIIQGMREEDLHGIYNIGLRLEEVKRPTK